MSFLSSAGNFRAWFAAMLQQIAHRQRYQHKHIAKMAGTTPKTVANWLRGDNGPTGEHLVRLMAADRDICEAILEMIRPDGPLSEDRRDEIWRALIGEE